MFEFFQKMGCLEFDFIPYLRGRISLLILRSKIGNHRVPESWIFNQKNIVMGGFKDCAAHLQLVPTCPLLSKYM